MNLSENESVGKEQERKKGMNYQYTSSTDWGTKCLRKTKWYKRAHLLSRQLYRTSKAWCNETCALSNQLSLFWFHVHKLPSDKPASQNVCLQWGNEWAGVLGSYIRPYKLQRWHSVFYILFSCGFGWSDTACLSPIKLWEPDTICFLNLWDSGVRPWVVMCSAGDAPPGVLVTSQPHTLFFNFSTEEIERVVGLRWNNVFERV